MTSLSTKPVLLYCSSSALAGGRAQFLHDFLGALATHGVSYKFTEDDGITGDLFHAAVEYLVVFTQGVGAAVAGNNNRHHLAADISYGSLQHHFRNGEAALAAGAISRR